MPFTGWIASIATGNGTVYALALGGDLVALRAADGQELWHVAATDVVTRDLSVDSGTVYTARQDNTTINAYRGSDGTRLWSETLAGGGSLDFTAAEGVVYASLGQSVIALRGSDGTVLWRQSIASVMDAPPTVAAGTVYVTTGGDVYALGGADGTVRWEYHAQVHTGPYAPDLGIGDGAIYVPESNGIVALSAANGAVMYTTPLDGPVESIYYALGVVYYGLNGNCSSGSLLHAMKATDGTHLWNVPLNECHTGAWPVMSTALYVSSNNSAFQYPQPGVTYALRPADGSILWQFQAPAGGVTDPVVG